MLIHSHFGVHIPRQYTGWKKNWLDTDELIGNRNIYYLQQSYFRRRLLHSLILHHAIVYNIILASTPWDSNTSDPSLRYSSHDRGFSIPSS